MDNLIQPLKFPSLFLKLFVSSFRYSASNISFSQIQLFEYECKISSMMFTIMFFNKLFPQKYKKINTKDSIRRSTSLHNLTRINFDISLYLKKITVSEHIRYSNNIRSFQKFCIVKIRVAIH